VQGVGSVCSGFCAGRWVSLLSVMCRGIQAALPRSVQGAGVTLHRKLCIWYWLVSAKFVAGRCRGHFARGFVSADQQIRRLGLTSIQTKGPGWGGVRCIRNAEVFKGFGQGIRVGFMAPGFCAGGVDHSQGHSAQGSVQGVGVTLPRVLCKGSRQGQWSLCW
jgi:hypothetical protein